MILADYHNSDGEYKAKGGRLYRMDEGRKRVLEIVAGIIISRHRDTADDLFGGPQPLA